jgi:hypothetical protein
MFIARVSKYDQNMQFNEFKKSFSKIRIIITITSLGININIPDIKRILNQDFSINDDIFDI